MKILVVGATGVLGRHVTPRLRERGHEVRVIARTPEQAEKYRRLGIEGARGDILDGASLRDAVTGYDVALHLATAIPKPGGPQDWALNDRIRREGTQHLLTACQEAGVQRYLQQSTVFLYEDRFPQLADETTPFLPHSLLQSTFDMEELVKASPLNWCILRGGLFYGPDTFEGGWRDAARHGTLSLPGDGSGRLSLIHVADMAQAVVLATENAPARSIFNVVDNQPLTYKELFEYIAAVESGPIPAAGGPLFLPSFACRNDRLKTTLGWAPAYPTYCSGLA
jgi:nucleoside-diphosphate-sugar epimerase